MRKNHTNHRNYWELVWTLARTDFKLRYHGSILGYLWALLRPLTLFLILNFVFSSVFSGLNLGVQRYSLQLLIGIILFGFFTEGTIFGLNSLLNKAPLITKIYVPRWTIILASTIQSTLVFLMNLLVIAVFFAWYGVWPGVPALLAFAFYILLTYLLILSFSFVAAPLYVRFRDLGQIWELASTALFYATPVIYPLSLLPAKYHPFILANPMAFIVHFTKTALTENRAATFWQNSLAMGLLLIGLGLSICIYRRLEVRVAEYL